MVTIRTGIFRVISLVQPGFSGRKPKWRIAWSTDIERWNPSEDGRLNTYKKLVKDGKAGIDYIRASKSYILETYSTDIIYLN